MTKIIIPSILVATILIGAIFSLMPVEQASTVHTTILADTPTLKISANPKDQVSAVATTLIWTSDKPMTILGFRGVELAQASHTTTVLTIVNINGIAMNTAAMTYTVPTSGALAQTFFINSDGEHLSTIAGTTGVGTGWEFPIEGVTILEITVVTTAGAATVANIYSLVAETGGTITPT